MMRRVLRAVLALLCLGLVVGLLTGAGCNEDSNGSTEQGEPPEAERTVETSVDDVALLASAERAFAFDLYREVRAEPGNLFFSPYSVSAALSMTLVGARGETASQIAEALRFTFDSSRAHEAFRDLNEMVNGRGRLAEPYEGEGFSFHVVNAAWAQGGYRLLEAFVETLTKGYGAGLRALDFEADPNGARKVINDWVSEETAQRILDLIPEGAIDAETKLVLTNAIYFNAPWLQPFDLTATTEESFTLLDGETVAVSMMHATESLPYATWAGGVAFELPYNGNELSMVVLVPDEGTFDSFDASLTSEVFDGIVASLAPRSIALGLPKFEFTYAASLVDPLIRLGMTDAFDADRADFSGITGAPDLFVSDVLHKAFVSVDEAGTEAAAATAVLFRATGIPAEPLAVTVDRPFLFVIRDRPTGSVLFVGRVVSP